jgi:SAM-dependent methyltransferase
MLRRAQAIPTLFLVTACMLAFEVAFTRICSVLLQYHVSFAVVSLAVLGLGLGGFAAYLWVGRRAERVEPACRAALLGIAPGMLLALVGLLQLRFAEHWTSLLFLILPVFACAGAFQSLLLRALAAEASVLYAADLIGGACGALLAVVALDALHGPIQTILVLAVVAALTAALSSQARARRGALVLLGLALAAAILQATTGWLDVHYERAPGKLIHALLQRTPQAAPRLVPGLGCWDATSRVDVLETRGPSGVQRLVFIDGETPTAMLAAQAATPGAVRLDVRDGLPALPYRLFGPQVVLSIGSGGGYDVVVAKRFGAAQVDAVELNSGVLRVVAAAREFTGDVYRQPGVSVHHAEGRRFARASPPGRYDLVILVLAQSLAGNLREYALSENYLYTREAMRDYLRVLRPGGTLALLVNNDVLLQRLQHTAGAVLAGAGQPASRCVAAVVSPAESPYDRLLLVRNAPFAIAQVESLMQDARAHGYTLPQLPDGSSPGSEVGPGSEIGPGSDATTAAATPRGLEPATDDRPFVYHLRGEIPPALRLLLGVSVTLLAVALAAVAWVARTTRSAARTTGAQLAAQAGYFVFLGLGFMMVEVLVLQKSLLVIGHPTWNLGLVLATFLLAAGMGSAATARFGLGSSPTLTAVLGFVAVGTVSIVRALELVHAGSDHWSLATRCVVLSATLFPLAFCMGMPFPAGIRRLDRDGAALVPWFWGLNGVASIAGSALIVAAVLELGFRASSVVPAACYAAAAICGVFMEKAPARTTESRPGDAANGATARPMEVSR